MHKLKILIVDDDKVSINILLDLLKHEEREIMVATDGMEGYQKFLSDRPDIVLSDINMPGLNGLDMVRKIRQHDNQARIAIFTNFDSTEHLLHAIQVGVNQFFRKPFDKEQFHRVIERFGAEVLERRIMERSLNRHENILHAINTMAEDFLQQNEWEETLIAQMRALKTAAEASAIFIFQNDDGDPPRLARKHLSLNDNSDATPPHIFPYASFARTGWLEQLYNGESVTALADQYPLEDQGLFYEYRVNSLLILPIYVGKRWWGFMGIGNNDNRAFDETDRNTLKTVAKIIGTALSHQNSINTLKMRSAIFKHTVDGVIITDTNNRIVQVNEAFTKITGYTQEMVEGKDPKFLRSGQHDDEFYTTLWSDIHRKGYWQGEIKNRKLNGEMYIAWLSISAIHKRNGEIENFIGVFSDITTKRTNEEKYIHMATHDALTGLSNRLILNDRLDHAILHAQRILSHVAVLFCDLDNFKPINDTYGHGVGDIVLQTCAEHLRAKLRSEDTICRYGGDEFVIVLEELDNTETLNELVEKVMAITKEPVEIEGHTIQVEMSIGVSVFPYDAHTPADVIARADEAMYRAKRAGKNRVAFYRAEGYQLDCETVAMLHNE